MSVYGLIGFALGADRLVEQVTDLQVEGTTPLYATYGTRDSVGPFLLSATFS